MKNQNNRQNPRSRGRTTSQDLIIKYQLKVPKTPNFQSKFKRKYKNSLIDSLYCMSKPVNKAIDKNKNDFD